MLNKPGFSIFIIALLSIPLLTFAQMEFRSTGTARPIEFTFGFQHEKGSFVWYKGQKEPIPLKLKSLDVDSSERETGQPDFYHYKYTEIYKGKATGEYGIIEWPRNVDDVYYIRFKDGKKFNFKLVQNEEFYDGKSMVLLRNIKVYYNSFYDDTLTLVHPDGKKIKHVLNHLEKNEARRLEIEDYNFDGMDDIAFETARGSISNRCYDVFIYNQSNQTFERLKEPYNTGCGRMDNLQIDKVNKRLITTCKNGTKRQTVFYKFNSSGKLIPVRKK